MADTEKQKAVSADKALFSKEQLMTSQKYAGRRDMLNALLDDTKLYPTADVDKAIEKYTKGVIK